VQAGIAGLTLGIVPRPVSADERTQNAAAQAQQFLGGFETPTTVRGQRQQIGRIEHAADFAAGNDALGEHNADPRAYTNLLRRELTVRRQLLRETLQAQQDELNASSVQHAQALLRDFGRAFDVRSKTVGPVAAMERLSEGVLAKMRHMRPAGAKVLGENTIAWARQQAHGNPQILAQVEKLEDGIKRSFSRTRERVFIVNGQILTGTRREWTGIKTALTTQTEQAREEATSDFTSIQEQAVGSLRAMGFSAGDARRLVRRMEHGGRRGKVAGERAALGPAAPSHAAEAMGAPTAHGDGVGYEGPQGLPTVRGPAARLNLGGADPDLAPYAQIGAQFGLRVSSGARPGSVTSYGNLSFHSSGDAIDMANGRGPDAAKMNYARAMIARFGSRLEELIYTPLGFSIKNGRRVPPIAAADHWDHVHVADTSGPGPGGTAFDFSLDGSMPGMFESISLTAPKSGEGGVPGAMVEASGQMYAAALEQRLNEYLGSMGGGADMGGGATSAGGAYGKSALMRLWRSAGGGGNVANLMAAIALAESGGNPNAHNPSGATGLWQILGNPFAGNARDPLTNARMAVAKYRSAGGFTPWTTFTGADTPGHAQTYRQYLGDGAGEGGVSPAMLTQALAATLNVGRASAGGPGPAPRSINSPLVSVGKIVVQSGGDARQTTAVVRRELDRFATMIAEELARDRAVVGAMG
jgi:hypothetical protein